ncbi:hypothetical protein [Tenacibaculum sp. 47A_GOM-205m]|uniref:hypothetical protein n=1 Tax=Tenacibaculum sp. 47A_GOM-205m TaxID=1380384 RepID=UPI00048C52AF|nr:hypothetical protein [Tenacibaculum sp. 47A_GOM-205m]
MKVNEWFTNVQDYQQGIILYSTLPGAKPNLVRLFFKKQSKANEEKLAYELSKYKEEGAIEDKVDKESVIPEIVPESNNVVTVTHQSKTQFFYRLNELHTSLHGKAREQRDLFQKAISLKLQLNELHELEEAKALSLCIEIENTFDKIDSIQKILKHYVDHKVVLDITEQNYSDLTPAQLLLRIKSKREARSKQKARVKKLMVELGQNLSKSQRTKKEVALEKAEAKILVLDQNVNELNNLINKG